MAIRKEELGYTTSRGVTAVYVSDAPKSRVAKCEECPRVTGSDKELPFFRERPERSEDSYYCGCHGWD